MKSIIGFVLMIAVLFCGCTALAEAAPEAPFSLWNADAPALNALIEYVEAVTDPESPDFIPEVDRIATFDMDGTLCAELNPTYLEYYLLAMRILRDPTYEPDEEMLEFGRMLRDCALDHSFPEGMDMLHAVHAARAYAGMTLQEFADFVTRMLVREADGFEGMTYAGAFFLPMIEVVEYLQDNDFKVYVCSGSDRFICRTFIEGMLDIPYENIIGMDVVLEATNQGDVDGLNYVFTPNDTLLRTDKLLIKNLKTNKVLQIAREIGRQPVLSFGNSSGDVSMHNFVLYNNRYKSAAFQLVADDEVRDYGSAEKGAQLKEKWEGMGFHVISMRDDWKTIYGEDVTKTGKFHWLDDLAEDTTNGDTLYQVALLQSLVQGYYDGIITVEELSRHGDTGIGTFEGVNGEMIVLNGVVYQAVADGSIAIPSKEETVPFSNVTFFDVDETLLLSGVADMAALQEAMNGVVNELGSNCFYMVKVEGTFDSIKVRSEYKQEKPYRVLDVALAEDQTEFDYEDIRGTVVGLYCPDYMGGLNTPGWHFHFINEDRSRGGHVLQISVKEAEAAFDMTDGFEMALTRDAVFQDMDLGKNVDEAIHKAETATVQVDSDELNGNE